MRFKPMLALVLALALCFSFAACGNKAEEAPGQEELPEENPEYPVTVGELTLEFRPGTVVSLSPSLTEKLYDMSFENRLLGVSDYCDFPEEVDALPRSGTAQLPDLELLEELKPDLVLSAAPLPEQALIALQQMDIAVAVLPLAQTTQELTQRYMDLAQLMEGAITGEEIGARYVDIINNRLELLDSALGAYTGEHGSKSAVYVRVLDFNVATGDTLEHQLMETIHLQNVAESHTGWVYPEGQWVDFKPDVIFSDNSITMKMLEQNTLYKGLPAVIGDVWLAVDGSAFERQSLRMLDVLTEMARYAYPDADLEAQPLTSQEEEEPEGEEEAPASQEQEDELLPLPGAPAA